MTPARRVAMNTGILYARMAITMFLSLYTTRVVLRALGVDDFGIFSLVGGTIGMLSFLNGSMSTATQRFMSHAQGKGEAHRLHQIFNVSLVLHGCIAVLTLLLLEGAGYLLFDRLFAIAPERERIAWLVFQFAAVSAFFSILAVPYDAVINARENMLLFAALGVVEAVLKLAIALVIVHASGDKLKLYGLLMAALGVLLLLLRVLYCRRNYPECEVAPRRYFDKSTFKEVSAFAGWSLLGTSGSMVANYGQAPLLNAFFGTAINAAQGVVAQISGQLGVFANVMLRALNPLITKSEGAGDRSLMLKASMVGSRFGFFLLAIIYVPVLLELPYLFQLWLGQVPEYAATFCYLLLLRNLVEQLYIPLATSISAVGRIKCFQLVNALLAIAPLVVTYAFFLAGFAPWALYVVFLTYSLIAFGVTLYYSKKVCGLSIGLFMRGVVLRCLCVFVMSLVVGSIPSMLLELGLPRLLSVCVFSTAAVIAAIWFMGLSREEQASAKIIGSRILSKRVAAWSGRGSA